MHYLPDLSLGRGLMPAATIVEYYRFQKEDFVFFFITMISVIFFVFVDSSRGVIENFYLRRIDEAFRANDKNQIEHGIHVVCMDHPSFLLLLIF